MAGKVAAEDVQQCLDELGLDMDGKKLHPESWFCCDASCLYCSSAASSFLVATGTTFLEAAWNVRECTRCVDHWVCQHQSELSDVHLLPLTIYFLEATHALGWLRPESTCQAMFKHGLSVASRCPLWMHKCGEVAHRIFHLRQRFESCLVYLFYPSCLILL